MVSTILLMVVVMAVATRATDDMKVRQEEVILRKLPVAEAHDYYELLRRRARRVRIMRAVTLASLLLALLAVQAGIPNGETILGIAGVVVAVSVVLHGVSATPLTSWYARRVAATTLAEERVSTASGLLRRDEDAAEPALRIEPTELVARLAGPDPPLLIDVRSRSSYDKDPEGIPGSVRVPPDRVGQWAEGRGRDQPIVTYCA